MVDTIESVTMKARNTSLIDCYNSCKQQDHINDHFYVQREVCLCSNSLHEHEKVDDRLCSKRCGGDVTEFCGGDQDFFTVYKEEHLKYSNNNKDQLCTYQSCVPSLDIGSESCNTSYRSLCGDFVSLKINTWAGSVNNCFTTRGLYLKSEVDCRIQNKERLWLGIFREHVTYFASGRPPLPRKPLTGCGVVTNNSTITYENCRQEKAFVCKTIQALNVRVYTGSSKTDYSTSTPQYNHADTQQESTAGPAIAHTENPSLTNVCYLVVIAMGCFIIIQSFFCFFIAVKRFVPKSNQKKQLPLIQDRDF